MPVAIDAIGETLDCVGSAFTGAYPHHGLHRGHPYFAVTDLAGTGGPHDAVDDLVHHDVVDQHLDAYFRHEVD